MDNITYDDSGEKEKFMVKDGGFNFGIIMDAAPKSYESLGKDPPDAPADNKVANRKCEKFKGTSILPVETEGRNQRGNPYVRAIEVIEALKKPKEKTEEKVKLNGNTSLGKEPLLPVDLSIFAKEPRDPDCFTIACSIGDFQLSHCTLELGTSRSVMPLKMAKRMGMTGIKKSDTSLILGNMTTCEPARIIDDVPVSFKGHIFLTTFFIMDTDKSVPNTVILGRPFLLSTGAEIFLKKGRVDFYLGPKNEKHQIRLKKKIKSGGKGSEIKLGECQFLQEIFTVKTESTPKRGETQKNTIGMKHKRSLSRIDRMRSGEYSGNKGSQLNKVRKHKKKRWYKKEADDPGIAETIKSFRETTTILIRDPPAH